MPLVHVLVLVLVPTQRNDLARCCRRPSRPSRISHGLLWTHVGCAGVGWDENGMGWARYSFLGCTAFSDWEHRMVVVAEGYGLYLPDVRGYWVRQVQAGKVDWEGSDLLLPLFCSYFG